MILLFISFIYLAVILVYIVWACSSLSLLLHLLLDQTPYLSLFLNSPPQTYIFMYSSLSTLFLSFPLFSVFTFFPVSLLIPLAQPFPLHPVQLKPVCVYSNWTDCTGLCVYSLISLSCSWLRAIQPLSAVFQHSADASRGHSQLGAPMPPPIGNKKYSSPCVQSRRGERNLLHSKMQCRDWGGCRKVFDIKRIIIQDQHWCSLCFTQ